MKKKFFNQSGITLIALVITIIVLLILAGVTIATLTGENGILTRANEAREKTKQAYVEEQVKLAVAASIGADGKINIDSLNTDLERIEGLTYNGSPISNSNKIINLPDSVDINGYKIKIESNGNTNEYTKIDYKSIQCGKIVENYKEGGVEWAVLYADDTNVYLITVSSPQQGPLEILSYTGTNDFNDLNKFPILSKGYLSKVYNNGNINYISSYNNMKATEFLLDINNWTMYVDANKYSGEKGYAEWAIGAPTIEMLSKSFIKNSNNESFAINYEINGFGYETNDYLGNGDSLPTTCNVESSDGTISDLYTIDTPYWLASPANSTDSNQNRIWCVNSTTEDGIGPRSYGSSYAFRPVVCLNSTVKFFTNVENDIETYMISY